MKIITVSDAWNVINTQGIRTIERDDTESAFARGRFVLVATYRNQRVVFNYDKKLDRDEMFKKLRAVMDREYGDKDVDNG